MTAAALGKLLEHFPNTEFNHVRLPFTDTPEKIQVAKESIDRATVKDGLRPVVIMSLGNLELRNSLKQANAYLRREMPKGEADQTEWFLKEFEGFSRRKELERAILKSADLIEKGEYDPVESIIKNCASSIF